MAGAVEGVQVAENGKSNDVNKLGIVIIKESDWWEKEGPVPEYRDNSSINSNWFPENFLFGAGSAAYQVEGAANEGGRGISVWDDFALRQPWRIDDGSNGNVAANMYYKFKEDIKMMKQMGLSAFRFSISWPRILPAGRVSGGVNREGIDYYNGIINTLIENEMTPFVTIFHWDLPVSLEKEYGGFLDKRIRKDYLEYANVCFWEFGDRVKHWTTFNEPEIYALQGYVNGFFPPGRVLPSPSNNASPLDRSAATGYTVNFNPRIGNTPEAARSAAIRSSAAAIRSSAAASDKFPPAPVAQPSDVYTVARNLLLAHAEAVQLYRTKFQEAQKGEIGIVLVTSHFVPYDESSEADKKACERARDFLLGWFLEPVMTGDYPASMLHMVSPHNLIRFKPEEKKKLAGSLDFLGMNYYSYQYIQDAPHLIGDGYLSDGKFQYKYGSDINDHTLPFSVPKGIYELLIYLDSYPQLKQLYITENGYHTATDFQLTAKMVCENDEDRIKYHQDHLANMLKAMKEVHYDVKGYFVWAWCDTYEWNSGYTMRFGLVYVDFLDKYARYPKNSAAWYARFLHSENPPPLYFKPSWIPSTKLLKGASKDDVGITLAKGSRLVLGYI